MSERGFIFAGSDEQRSLKRFADETDAHPRRDVPLVPAASIAGRALVTVVAIMTFLAGLTAGTAMLIAGAADGWRGEVAREMTIQVRPVTGRDLDADVTAAARRRTRQSWHHRRLCL